MAIGRAYSNTDFERLNEKKLRTLWTLALSNGETTLKKRKGGLTSLVRRLQERNKKRCDDV